MDERKPKPTGSATHGTQQVGPGASPQQPLRSGATANGEDSTPPHADVPHDHDHDHDRRATLHPNANAHANAHASAHERATKPAGSFPHERLDAYRVALELAGVAKRLAAQIPRGHRSLADHLLRAATNTVLLLAEGANRRGAGEKRQRFVESRGECGEAAAAADLAVVMDLAEPAAADELKLLAGRVSAMLTRLIARLR